MNTRTRPEGQLNFYSIIASTLLSNFGSFLNMMALNILILQITNSAAWVGLVLGVRIISGMLVSPHLGVLSDRFDRKQLMLVSDFVLALGVTGLLFCPEAHLKAYILVLMVLVGIFSSLFDICMKAAIPVMMGKADTLRANSILLGGRNFVIAGSALCAVFAHVWMTRFDTIFVIDAVTYLISGFVLLTVNIKTSELPVSSQACAIGMVAKPKPVRKNIFGEYAEIWRLRNAPILFLFMTVMFIDAFASASHNVGWPLFSKSYSPERPMFLYGFVLFFWAGGNVLGIVFLNKLAMLKRLAPEVLYLFFTIMMSVGMILTFAFDAKLLIAVAALIAGVGDGTYQTYFTTYVQKVDDAVRGKVFALTNIFLKTGFGLGFIVIPMVMDSLGPAWTAALFHGLVVLCCGLGLWYPTSVMVRCFASKGQMLCVKGSNAERQRVRC